MQFLQYTETNKKTEKKKALEDKLGKRVKMSLWASVIFDDLMQFNHILFLFSYFLRLKLTLSVKFSKNKDF